MAFAWACAATRLNKLPRHDSICGPAEIVGVAFGLMPAFSSKQTEVVTALKEGASGASHGSRSVVGNVVVIIQMALAMLVRTFANLKAVNPGFDPQNLLVFGLDTTYSNRAGENRELLYRELQKQLTALPGVISASYGRQAASCLGPGLMD
jgi:hypothetical protein